MAVASDQLDHMQIICTSLQTDNHQHLTTQLFTDQTLFLMPNQQCQSTEGNKEDWLNTKQKKQQHLTELTTE